MKAGLLCLVLVALGVAACVPATRTPAPTQALIASTITDTPVPSTPTLTPRNLTSPDEVNATDIAASVPTTVPAAALPLIQDALANLSGSLDVDADTIQLVRLESAVWFGEDLSCTEAETNAAENDTGIDGFRLVFTVDDMNYEYHTDIASRIVRCDAITMDSDTQADALLSVDPVAAELVVLAQRRLAQELDLPLRRIRLEDVTPITWEDASLGCPQPGQQYASIEIDGYRILLSVGDNFYAFHTDSGRLSACAIGQERLPGQPSPTPTPETELTAEVTDEPESTEEAIPDSQ